MHATELSRLVGEVVDAQGGGPDAADCGARAARIAEGGVRRLQGPWLEWRRLGNLLRFELGYLLRVTAGADGERGFEDVGAALDALYRGASPARHPAAAPPPEAAHTLMCCHATCRARRPRLGRQLATNPVLAALAVRHHPLLGAHQAGF